MLDHPHNALLPTSINYNFKQNNIVTCEELYYIISYISSFFTLYNYIIYNMYTGHSGSQLLQIIWHISCICTIMHICLFINNLLFDLL